MALRNALEAELTENFQGEPWHGSPIRRLVEGLKDEETHAHPVPNARSIAELLLHAAAWIEIVERRLRGETVSITPALDFPSAERVRWEDIVARLDTARERLLLTLRSLDDAALMTNAPEKNYTNEHMLRGLMHHNTYHSAQIAILKKFYD